MLFPPTRRFHTIKSQVTLLVYNKFQILYNCYNFFMNMPAHWCRSWGGRGGHVPTNFWKTWIVPPNKKYPKLFQKNVFHIYYISHSNKWRVWLDFYWWCQHLPVMQRGVLAPWEGFKPGLEPPCLRSDWTVLSCVMYTETRWSWIDQISVGN